MRTRRQAAGLALAAFATLTGCGEAGGGGEATAGTPAAAPDAVVPAPDAVVPAPDAVVPAPDAVVPAPDAAPPPPEPSGYCETIAPFFCEFYVRCGRMAVDTVGECLEVFGPACNAAYEPQYVAHANAGLLRLDAGGLAACEAHLASVACEVQVFDLDGPCAGVWAGLSPAGAPCAPGIGSFVCASGTTCVLDLSFCGVCEPAAPTGGACGPSDTGALRCGAEDHCVDGLCVRRAAPGEACAVREDCVVAADCLDGTCRTFERAAAGEACDQSRRCPYHSTCLGGTCVVNRRQGEACAPGEACDGGRCAEGTCVPFGDADAPCDAGGECLSGQCDAGRCAAPLASCFSG